MPHRFHITSTNRMIQLSYTADREEFSKLYKIDQQIQELILKFNLGVERMFSDGSTQGLTDCCTSAGLARMQVKFNNWTNQKIKALNLVSCDFLSFDLAMENGRATAFTFEKWIFVYTAGKEVPTTGSVDGYDIHLVNGLWRVDSVKFYAPMTDPH